MDALHRRGTVGLLCPCVFGGGLMRDGVSSVRKTTESLNVWEVFLLMSIRLRVL